MATMIKFAKLAIISMVLSHFLWSPCFADQVDDLKKESDRLRWAGQFDQAIDEINEALKIRPDDRLLLQKRAFALMDADRAGEGLQDLLRANDIQPNDVNVLDNIDVTAKIERPFILIRRS